MWSPREELIEIAKVASRHNAIIAFHKRSSGDWLLKSTEEVVNIAQEANVHLHISHIKALGKQNIGKMKPLVFLLEQAISRGLSVTADVYPYDSGSGYLHALLPREIFDGGLDNALKRLEKSKWRKKVKENIIYDINWDNIKIISAGNNSRTDLLEKSIGDIARNKNQEPLEVVMDIIIQEKGNILMNLGGLIDEKDIKTALKWKHSMVGSDGLPAVGDLVHPRTYGTFSRIISKYVNNTKLFSIEEAVWKMTELPAKTFGIKNRGTITIGNYADLLVVKPNEIKEASSYSQAKEEQAAEGIYHVIVNGKQIISNGYRNQNRPGIILERS